VNQSLAGDTVNIHIKAKAFLHVVKALAFLFSRHLII